MSTKMIPFTYKSHKLTPMTMYKNKVIAETSNGSIYVIDFMKCTVERAAIYNHHLERLEYGKMAPNSIDYAKAHIDRCIEAEEKNKLSYMMMDRLRMDLDYYLGASNRNPRHLYYGSIQEHFDEFKKLYESFPEPIKPCWITSHEIEQYRKQLFEPQQA